MLRHTAHRTESRYEILGLFSASMIAASVIVVAIGMLLPYVAHALPADKGHISLLVTALLGGGMLTTAISGAATDRFGDRAVLAACGIIMGATLVASAAIASFWWIFACFVLYGMGFAAINPVGSHAILFFFKPQERGMAMGIRQMGMPLGGVLGAMLIATTGQYLGYRASLCVAGVLVWIVTVGAAALYREPSQLSGKPVRAGILFSDMLRIAREPRLIGITLTCIVLFAVQVALMGFFPWTLVNQAHVSVPFASALFVIAQLAAAAGRLLWGWTSDRFFHRNRILPLAVTCVLCSAAALAVAGVAHMSLPALVGIALALGFAAEGWFGMAIIAMAEVGGEEHAGSALGFSLTWVFAAGVVTPALFQLTMQRAGIPAAWHGLAVLSLIGLVPAAMLLIAPGRREAAPVPRSP